MGLFACSSAIIFIFFDRFGPGCHDLTGQKADIISRMIAPYTRFVAAYIHRRKGRKGDTISMGISRLPHTLGFKSWGYKHVDVSTEHVPTLGMANPIMSNVHALAWKRIYSAGVVGNRFAM
jgi:hypothetical protein